MSLNDLVTSSSVLDPPTILQLGVESALWMKVMFCLHHDLKPLKMPQINLDVIAQSNANNVTVVVTKDSPITSAMEVSRTSSCINTTQTRGCQRASSY